MVKCRMCPTGGRGFRIKERRSENGNEKESWYFGKYGKESEK